MQAAMRNSRLLYRSCSSQFRFASFSPAVDYSLGVMFPGQGAQYVGMGSKLAAELSSAGRLFEQASAILEYDLLTLCATGPKGTIIVIIQ